MKQKSITGRKALFTYPYYGQPCGYPDYHNHNKQIVTIIRKLTIKEADGDNAGKMFEVRASDGWTGCVWRDELRLKKE